MDTIKVDAKGRFSVPSNIRNRLKMHEGDVYFIQLEDGGIIRLAKAINPLDQAAAEAIEEYEAGQTMSLADFVCREGVDFDIGPHENIYKKAEQRFESIQKQQE